MPKLTWQLLEALDKLSRARNGTLPAKLFQTPTINNMCNNDYVMFTGFDHAGNPYLLSITETGKRLVEAYRLGKAKGKYPGGKLPKED